jgi:uncharacterized coiled-coil protein SlyX
MKIVRRALLITAAAGLLFAQRPAPQQRSLEDRVTILETKSDSQFGQLNDHLKRIDDRLDRLEKTQTEMQVVLATLNTKMSTVQWFGTTLGALILASLWGSAWLIITTNKKSRVAWVDRARQLERGRAAKAAVRPSNR